MRPVATSQNPAPPAAQVSAPQASAQQAVTTPGQNVDFPALQARAADLVERLAGLHVQREGLSRQMQRLTGDAREVVVVQRTNLDVQIAQSNAELENIRAQIASRARVPMEQVTQSGQIVVPPPYRRRASPDPDMIIGMSFTLLMVLFIPASIAFAKRIWRGGPKPTAPLRDDLLPRFDRLEHAVDVIAIEIERISESQRFMTKVFAERSAERSTERTERAPAEPPGALAEEKPIRALGAGAAEPIIMQARQGVRQSITPH